MEYKDDFFVAYSKYLTIPAVRLGHQRIFDIFMRVCNPNGAFWVNDFGCGTCEFGRYLEDYLSLISYTGIDLDISRANLKKNERNHLIVGDYNKVMPDPKAYVVSLFATEIHLPIAEREALYHKWKSLSCAGKILVGGFYYDAHPEDERYTEAVTGLTIYQTPRSMPLTPGELRLTQQVPAGMFTDPFTEVWRIL